MTRMSNSAPVPTLVIYRPKKGKDQELAALVKKHEPALRSVGLITSDPVRTWRAHDKRKDTDCFVELMTWRDGEASGLAHQTPEVMAVWETMGPVLEDMSILQLEPLE
jgi:quinol monooxygenase YgiN